MAAVFVASFTAAALAHDHTVLALLLCGVAILTLVSAVIGANVRSPRQRPTGAGHLVHQDRQLPPAPGERPGGRRR